MTNEDGVLRSIAWRDVCPWVILFRLYHLSLSLQLLALGLLATWAISLGWRTASAVILSEGSRARPDVQQFLASVLYWPEPEPSLALPDAASSEGAEAAAVERIRVETGATPPQVTIVQRDVRPLAAFWHALQRTPLYGLVEPFRRLFDPTATWNQLVFYFVGGMWSLVVASWLGGAISRTAIVRLGRDERVGLRDSLDFARRKLPSYLAAPLLPLAAIFVVSVPLFLLGLIMRLNIGVAMAGLMWLPVGIVAFIIALFAIGVLFGWPLMWSAISAEGSDAFDAISRAYAYTFQRPLQYLAYALMAAVLGWLGWLVVGLFGQSVVQFAMWATGAGAGVSRLVSIENALASGQQQVSSLVWFGSLLIHFFNRCFLGIQVAYGYSFLWSAAAAIYLLLRRDADQTELDDVYLEEEDGVTYGLPPLKTDAAGVPGAEPMESPDLASTDTSSSP
jgi:hypothetical protein